MLVARNSMPVSFLANAERSNRGRRALLWISNYLELPRGPGGLSFVKLGEAMGDDPEARPLQGSLLGSEEAYIVLQGPAPAVMDELWRAVFSVFWSNLRQALPSLVVSVSQVCRFSNMSLLFLAVHCPTDLGSLILFSNFFSVCRVHCLVLSTSRTGSRGG